MTFVDGSNLFGALRDVGVQISNYELLYRCIFHRALEVWRHRVDGGGLSSVPAIHSRVCWYVTSDMDQWELSNDNTRRMLRDRFDNDHETRGRWIDEVIKRHQMQAQRERNPERTGNVSGLNRPGGSSDPGDPDMHTPTIYRVIRDLCDGERTWSMLSWQERHAIESEAWDLCFADLRNWYEQKQQTLAGMNRFYHAVSSRNDFLELRRCGRWKVDFLHKSVVEKGLDTSLAVDMVGLIDNYDVALLITGDADGIPSVSYAKNRGRHVGVVEFLPGSPQNPLTRSTASRLKAVADFVVSIYEQDLLDLKEQGREMEN
ncbi:MAG: NYN domain-containing protein [Planctomycetia bacterium]|nr:NYN domain-containing protein [Planctomycetia bacterium]